MKIGIIGCGYVGQGMALHWKQQGHQVAVTTRRSERIPYLQSFADHVHLLGEQSLHSFVEQQELLLMSMAPDASSDYASTYLQTARQVAKQAHQTPSLQQILYTGSASVYGDHQGAWVDENTPIACTHENAKILYETEQILLECSSKNLKVCIFRLGEIYGPGREIEQRLKRMQHQPFAGTGQSYTNLIHLADILNALNFALEHRLQGLYNLCSDFHVTRKQFYDQICQREKFPPIQWDAQRINVHGGNRCVSNQKIKNSGFTFTYPLYFTEAFN